MTRSISHQPLVLLSLLGVSGCCSRRADFKLSALDVDTIGVQQGASRADVEKAMAGHVLAMTETVGLYQKQPQ